MNTRMYRSEDCKGIIELFYNTVHSVNANTLIGVCVIITPYHK